MKKIVLIAVVAVLAFACTQQKPVDYTLISGKLENYNNGDLLLRGNDRWEASIEVAEDGTFSDTIYKEGEIYIMLDRASTKIYAFNGAVLNLAADASDFSNSAVISGENAGMSNYLITKLRYDTENMKDIKAYFSAEESEFWTAEKKKLAAHEAELAKVSDISEELRELEKRSLKAGYISGLSNYATYHGYFTGNEDFKPSNEFQEAANNVDFNDGELYEYSNDYKRLLMGASYAKAAKLVESGEASSNAMGNLMVAEKIENETIREALLFSAVDNSLNRAENAKELFEKYMALATDKENREQVEEKFNTVTKLAVGKPSPKFVNYENYAGGTSSLDDFKGKYVYIDVWATWCGPCKAEIPHLQKVEEKYHGRNIEFVSISVDKENAKETWRKMIADKEMGGVQLIASDTKFMDDYVITGIPRFILIDPEGNIVSKNAPRPSEEKLIVLFNELGI